MNGKMCLCIQFIQNPQQQKPNGNAAMKFTEHIYAADWKSSVSLTVFSIFQQVMSLTDMGSAMLCILMPSS